MNRKVDVLDSWIIIEQLTEGNIKLSDEKYQTFDERQFKSFFETFSDFLEKEKLKLKQELKKLNKKNNFDKAGIVMYFDIFNFQEIIDILRNKYEIQATHEEINLLNKFSMALYFDNQLNFIPEKFFYTASGFLRYNKEFSKDFLNFEKKIQEDLGKKFKEKNIDAILNELFEKHSVALSDCRYSFEKNLESSDANLHSFYIEDLEKAKLIESENLKRYFEGFSGKKINLDTNTESNHFNPESIQEILQPVNYPLGRFPSNSDYSLSFMQAIAVNLAIEKENHIRSVNGPPGTGKTTLLKDIFADLIVQQAFEMCYLSNKKIKGTLAYHESYKMGVLPNQISDKNIIVASSNNGAVQNIVNELPKIEEISHEFQEEIFRTDYFRKISNSKLTISWVKEQGKSKRLLESDLLKEENWGLFSLEGGKSNNVKKLLLNIEFIEKHLKEEYKSNEKIYHEFLQYYTQLSDERTRIQKYYNEIKEFHILKQETESSVIKYKEEKIHREKKLKEHLYQTDKQFKVLRNKLNENTELQIDYERKMQENKILYKEVEREFDILLLQQPNFLWIQKIFNTDKMKRYCSGLVLINEKLVTLNKQRQYLDEQIKEVNRFLKNEKNKMDSLKITNEQKKLDFNNWKIAQKLSIKKLEEQLNQIIDITSKSDIQEIDFSKTYEELQNSSPWFTKEFRIKQSNLFILALEVRKQFLYENKQSLSAARQIWSDQNKNVTKENGHQLLLASWEWINLAIPVISTTFASFGRMFRHLRENTIANLFIDEAGQAPPQSSVGAIYRSKKVMVVGDPFQIKPVLSLDSEVLHLLGRFYRVDEKFLSSNASTQTIVDSTSKFGFQKNDKEWIGIPLWVHRRSNYPMFTISNEISYENLMVQGKPSSKAYGQSEWFDISGQADNKFVKEQSDFLINIIKA